LGAARRRPVAIPSGGNVFPAGTGQVDPPRRGAGGLRDSKVIDRRNGSISRRRLIRPAVGRSGRARRSIFGRSGEDEIFRI